jgi:glycosyltransferase involved in cell wall biosynthesis
MRILCHSTAPWASSSYSILVNRTVPNIVAQGHNVTLSTWYGLSGAPLPWGIKGKDGRAIGSVTVLPNTHGDTYGAEVMGMNYQKFKAEVLLTISDIWVFQPKHTHATNFVPWFPVDYDPLPVSIIEAMEPAIYPMVYSKWGQQVVEKAGLKAHYVPCSAPARTYSPGDKTQARSIFDTKRDLGFLVTMVAANKDTSDRKGFSEALQGFAKFAQKREDAMLYVHTNWSGVINIGAMAARLGIQDRVIQPDQYAYNMGLIGEDYMAAVYRASDVHLNCCKSEGFGLPIVESQMCGCPVIAPDYSTTDELLFAGWKVQGQADWAYGAESFRYRVYVDSVADALEEAYQNRDNETLRAQAVKGAKKYDNDIVFNRYWRPALVEIEKKIEKGKRVYEVAKGVNLESIPGRRRQLPAPVPAAG